MSGIWDVILLGMALIVLVATFLPLSGSKRWWVRGLDFPRVQIMIAALLLIALIMVFSPFSRIPSLLALAVAAIYQATRIAPYTAFWPTEVTLAPDHAAHWVTAMSSNVEMGNRDYQKVATEVNDTDPDILFLMETDGAWDAALTEQLSRYPYVKRDLRDNYYGMIFATKLPVEDCVFTELTHDDTPTLFAKLRAHDGTLFRFIGLHPRPPLPGDDTDDRDAQIHYTAEIARMTDLPLVIMGDFNDAAWSDTSRRFKKIGGYLDPRIGRGIYPSFDANSWLIRAPIDQLFMSADIQLSRFWRGPHVGSDHFPIHAAFCPRLTDMQPALDPVKASNKEAADLDPIKTDLRHGLKEDQIV